MFEAAPVSARILSTGTRLFALAAEDLAASDFGQQRWRVRQTVEDFDAIVRGGRRRPEAHLSDVAPTILARHTRHRRAPRPNQRDSARGLRGAPRRRVTERGPPRALCPARPRSRGAIGSRGSRSVRADSPPWAGVPAAALAPASRPCSSPRGRRGADSCRISSRSVRCSWRTRVPSRTAASRARSTGPTRGGRAAPTTTARVSPSCTVRCAARDGRRGPLGHTARAQRQPRSRLRRPQSSRALPGHGGGERTARHRRAGRRSVSDGSRFEGHGLARSAALATRSFDAFRLHANVRYTRLGAINSVERRDRYEGVLGVDFVRRREK